MAGEPCRSIWTKTLEASGAYGLEEHLDGWFNITAEGGDAFVYPGAGARKWNTLFEGIFIPQGKTITRRFDDADLGYYSAAGHVRIERIEFVPLMED
jgi:hypothetical protein